MKIRTWIVGVFLASLWAAASTPVMAADPDPDPDPDPDVGLQPLSQALFAGPLAAPNPSMLPPGHLYVQLYLFDVMAKGHFDQHRRWHTDQRNDHSWRFISAFQHRLSERTTVAVIPVLGFNQTGSGQGSGGPRMGDVTVRMHYLLNRSHPGTWVPRSALALSEVAPTGRFERLGQRPAAGMGRGQWVTKLGWWAQSLVRTPTGRWLRARLALSFARPNRAARVHGVSVYGTPPGFRGRVAIGNTFGLDLAFEYSLTRHWVPVLELLYHHTSAGWIHGHVHPPGAAPQSYRRRLPAASSIDLVPALEYNWSGSLALAVGVQVTVAGHNATAVVAPQMSLCLLF